MVRSIHPVAAAVLATIIVIAVAAFGASHLTVHTESVVNGQVEKVSVTKNIAVAPLQGSVNSSNASNASNAPSLDQPQIARTAKVSLYVENVDKTAGVLARLARENAGIVFSSDISNASDSSSQPGGQMELRVRADRFDAAMSGVAQTGKVRERSTSAEDLTSDMTDADARLRNLLQTEADIRQIMSRSGSVSQIMDAENQLSQVREQIETLEAQIKSMRTRVAYATIDVDMQAEAASAPVQPTAAAQLASAWHGAVAFLGQFTVGLLAALVWVLVFIPYLLLGAAVFGLVYRRLAR